MPPPLVPRALSHGRESTMCPGRIKHSHRKPACLTTWPVKKCQGTFSGTKTKDSSKHYSWDKSKHMFGPIREATDIWFAGYPAKTHIEVIQVCFKALPSPLELNGNRNFFLKLFFGLKEPYLFAKHWNKPVKKLRLCQQKTQSTGLRRP